MDADVAKLDRYPTCCSQEYDGAAQEREQRKAHRRTRASTHCERGRQRQEQSEIRT
jgi:hypothetical protein